MEVNKYKIIISNKNIYEEIEIPIDAKVYRVGTSIESDYRLYRDAFFENVQLDFSNNNGSWMVMCSDNIYLFKLYHIGRYKKIIDENTRTWRCFLC